MSELKRSVNKVQINGLLGEMNLALETKKTKITKVIDGSKVEKEVECKVISKKEFANPAFTVLSNGKTINVEYFGLNFGVSEKALDDDGEIIDNKNFKALETIMETYVSMANLSKYKEQLRREGKSDAEVEEATATRVKVDGSLTLNEYASTKRNSDGEFYSRMEVVAFAISSTNVSEEDSADAEITGVITKIGHETKDDVETGRLNVELVSFGYNGVAEPFKFVVEEDLATDFEEYYEIGSSVKIYYEISVKTVGSQRVASSGGFGRRDAKIQSGYSVTEYSVFRGEEPFEEENEYFVDIETTKKALTERENMKAEKIKNAVEKAKESKNDSSPKGASAKASASNSPFGAPSKAPTKKANPFG